MTKRPRHRQVRRGFISIEAIMVLVVLIVATFGAVQFGLALVVKQAVSHAATVAAREAAKGADIVELEAVVERVLAGHQIEIGDYASIVLERGPSPMNVTMLGDLDCLPPAAPTIAGDEVRVTLCVSLAAPPFVNGLQQFGIDMTACQFQVSSVATLE